MKTFWVLVWLWYLVFEYGESGRIEVVQVRKERKTGIDYSSILLARGNEPAMWSTGSECGGKL